MNKKWYCIIKYVNVNNNNNILLHDLDSFNLTNGSPCHFYFLL